MQSLRAFALLITLLGSQLVSAQYDLFASNHFTSEKDEQIKKATVAIVNNNDLKRKDLDSFGFAYSFCSSQNFKEEKMWSNCTGVLISKDIILTAGHCILSQSKCPDKTFVFDYLSNDDIIRVQRNRNSSYTCKKVLYWSRPSKENLVDYALIQLNRPVSDREPIALSTNTLERKQNIKIVGHPLGLPMKFSIGYVSEKNAEENKKPDKPFYSTQGLVYGGLSGGGVYDEDDALVGLLVRGESNINSDFRCQVVKTCDSNDCPWAEVQKLPVEFIQKLIKKP